VYLLRTGVLGSHASMDQLNLLSLFAFAGLTGLFSKQAIDMLADVFSVVFKRSESKDKLANNAANHHGPPPPALHRRLPAPAAVNRLRSRHNRRTVA
jgi:hypothetical protein